MIPYFNNADVVGGYNNDLALARLKNINSLVDILNKTVYTNNSSLSFTYRITETLGVSPLTLTQMVGSSAVAGDCPNCKQGVDTETCGIVKGFYCVDIGISLSRVSPGVYDITLSNVPTQINDIVLNFGNVSTLGVIINASRLTNTTYRITAFDTQTGIAVDNVLTDATIQVTVW